MFDLTIQDKVYQFNFGMGFMREINKKHKQPVDGWKNEEKNMGLVYSISSLFDNDIEELVEVLYAANIGQKPRVTKELLDSYIDDVNTDIDELFVKVLDDLKHANATKKVALALQAEVDKALAAQA